MTLIRRFRDVTPKLKNTFHCNCENYLTYAVRCIKNIQSCYCEICNFYVLFLLSTRRQNNRWKLKLLTHFFLTLEMLHPSKKNVCVQIRCSLLRKYSFQVSSITKTKMIFFKKTSNWSVEQFIKTKVSRKTRHCH